MYTGYRVVKFRGGVAGDGQRWGKWKTSIIVSRIKKLIKYLVGSFDI